MEDSVLKRVFPIFNDDDAERSTEEIDESILSAANEEIKQNPAFFFSVLDLEIKAALRNKVAPKFWNHLDESLCTDNVANSENTRPKEIDLFQRFVTAVNELQADVNYYKEMLQRAEKMAAHLPEPLECPISSKLINWNLRQSLLSQLPAHFEIYIAAFFDKCFRLFNKSEVDKAESGISELELNKVHCLDCCGISANQECVCANLMLVIKEVNSKLLNMEMLDNIAGYSIKKLVQRQIAEHINLTCSGSFDKTHIQELKLWLENSIISWLMNVYTSNPGPHLNINKILDSFRVKLKFYIYEQLSFCIIDQFFSVIIDFPDSIPIMDDLKFCMRQIDLRKYFTQKLKKSLKDRLLHPGVNTMDILIGYVATIKTIRYLDNSGVILDIVSTPIKEYLRTRTDTVRQVITALTEDGPTELSDELARFELQKDEKDAAVAKNDISEWENWQPEPWDLDPNRATADAPTTTNSKSSDIISMVVEIYGSKELFMVEYRNLMADRLLTQLDFNVEREIRNLELLKVRFGEPLLHDCEVMLKDVTDSKRINAHIQTDSEFKDTQTFGIDTLIISDQFWPTFNKEHLVLPYQIESEFKKYTKSFESYKGNRTLNWRTVTGKVNISLEYEGRTLELTVPPTQAVIIYHFQNKGEWSLDELSSIMKIPPTTLKRRISYWTNQNIISEDKPGIYTLMEYKERAKRGNNMNTDEEEEVESAMASPNEQREEELQVRWTYIVGMLTNLGALPLDRIHQMLTLFVPDGGKTELSKEDLNNFLLKKVREHALMVENGKYKLP